MVVPCSSYSDLKIINSTSEFANTNNIITDISYIKINNLQ